MTPEIITGLLRSLLLFLSATLASHGIKILDGGMVDTLAGALTSIIVIGFSIRAKQKKAAEIEAAKVTTTVIVETPVEKTVTITTPAVDPKP